MKIKNLNESKNFNNNSNFANDIISTYENNLENYIENLEDENNIEWFENDCPVIIDVIPMNYGITIIFNKSIYEIFDNIELFLNFAGFDPDDDYTSIELIDDWRIGLVLE